jgi:hypothetical protein
LRRIAICHAVVFESHRILPGEGAYERASTVIVRRQRLEARLRAAEERPTVGIRDCNGFEAPMTDRTIDLDSHRGMAAQKATELRRLLAEVREDESALRVRQDALEAQLIAAPAVTWEDAAEKARYLLNLFAVSLAAQDPRRQQLIAAVLEDFTRLCRESPGAPKGKA